MATSVRKQLKRNVIDEVQYKHKPLALAMLTIFLWGPFVALTITLFYLTRHTDVRAPYEMTQAQHDKVVKQLVDYKHNVVDED